MKNRNYYMHIRKEAEKDADMCLNQHWKQALQNLAFAADIMDAVTARSSGPAVSQPSSEEEGWKNDETPPATAP
jgi:hypothetical protein